MEEIKKMKEIEKCKIEIFDDNGKSEIIESDTFIFICKDSKGIHTCSFFKGD
jgi:hypothetical protein